MPQVYALSIRLKCKSTQPQREPERTLFHIPGKKTERKCVLCYEGLLGQPPLPLQQEQHVAWLHSGSLQWDEERQLNQFQILLFESHKQRWTAFSHMVGRRRISSFSGVFLGGGICLYRYHHTTSIEMLGIRRTEHTVSHKGM